MRECGSAKCAFGPKSFIGVGRINFMGAGEPIECAKRVLSCGLLYRAGRRVRCIRSSVFVIFTWDAR